MTTRVSGTTFEAAAERYALGLGSSTGTDVDAEVDNAIAEAAKTNEVATPPVNTFDQTGTYDLLAPPAYPTWPSVQPPEWSDRTYLVYGWVSDELTSSVAESLGAAVTSDETLKKVIQELNKDNDGDGQKDLDAFIDVMTHALGIYAGGADGAVFFVDCDAQSLVE